MFHFETQPAPQENIQDSPAEKEGGARVDTTRGNSTVIQISAFSVQPESMPWHTRELILAYDLNWAELQSTFFAIFLLDCG